MEDLKKAIEEGNFEKGLGLANELLEKNPDIKSKVQSAGELTCNFEATDGPLKGHLKISAGKISGGSTPAEKFDLKVSGPTKVLTGMLTGEVDPVRGFMSKQYKMEGSMAIGMKLAPVMTAIGKIIKGG